ncbi:MAG TPA: glycosyltransferase family 39 protein [Gaiellaceae bacterium]|nr:glycosyltransferase family 39 protein [Gaiellaceae bacterium]
MAIVSAGAKRGSASRWSEHPARLAYRLVAAQPLLPLLVLLVVVTFVFPDRQDDEAGYLELARNITHGHYVTGRPDALLDADPSYPDLWFGPGLPLLLAAPVALGLPLGLIRLVGPLALFGALALVFRLLQRYLSRRAALAWTYALGVYLPFYTLLPNLHSEPLAILFAVAALAALARVAEGDARRWQLLGGAALAGLALTRVDYGWVVTVAAIVFLAWWALSRRREALRLALTCAVALVLCLPWLAYTYAKTDRAFQWGNSGSLSLYWMSSPYSGDLGDWQQASAVFTDPHLARHRPFFETLRGLPLGEQNARLERRALSNIVHHPVAYAENVAANVSRLLFDTPYSYAPQRLSALYFALPNALVLAVALLAAAVAVRIGSQLVPLVPPLAVLVAVAFGLHALVAAYPRMLTPIVPMVVMLAALTAGRHLRLASALPHAREARCR